MKTPQQAREAWVAALRSGEFDQISDQLADGRNGFCCLGVACELATRDGVIPTYDGHELFLPSAVQNWLGLTENDGRLKERLNREGEPADELKWDGYVTLAELNDTAGMRFDQIARVIEDGKVRFTDDNNDW